MTLQVYHDPTDEDLGNPLLVRLIRYWRECGGEDKLPGRVDIQPGDLVPVLSHMMLIDVAADGEPRYSYRLIGTALVDRIGFDATKQPVETTYEGADWIELRKDYDFVVRERRPCLTLNDMVIAPEHRRVRYRRLLLPLASDGSNVDMLMGAIVFLE